MLKELKEVHYTKREESRRKRHKKLTWKLRNAPGLIDPERLVKGFDHYFKDSGEPWKLLKPMSN